MVMGIQLIEHVALHHLSILLHDPHTELWDNIPDIHFADNQHGMPTAVHVVYLFNGETKQKLL